MACLSAGIQCTRTSILLVSTILGNYQGSVSGLVGMGKFISNLHDEGMLYLTKDQSINASFELNTAERYTRFVISTVSILLQGVDAVM